MYVNLWAVLLAAVVSMAVGAIWYGPLFGKVFSATMGWDKLNPEQRNAMKKGMGINYLGQFVASLVMFYILAMIMSGLRYDTVRGGLLAAFWVWLGFIVPLKYGEALWGGKMKLFWLSIGNMLITLLLGGIILGTIR